jgi:hypothetical protein
MRLDEPDALVWDRLVDQVWYRVLDQARDQVLDQVWYLVRRRLRSRL